jgi:ubiquitin-protein ligase E3 C
LNDLRSLDPELHKQLLWLRTCNELEELGLDFTVQDEHLLGRHEEHIRELIPNGSNVPVTQDNKYRYIYAMANYKLNVQIKDHCEAFVDGIKDLLDIKWLQLFNQYEVQELISGGNINIDTFDLQANTVYQRYTAESEPVLHFWNVVHTFTQDEKRKLLKFVTGCSGPPLLGFQYLTPKFAITEFVAGSIAFAFLFFAVAVKTLIACHPPAHA